MKKYYKRKLSSFSLVIKIFTIASIVIINKSYTSCSSYLAPVSFMEISDNTLIISNSQRDYLWEKIKDPVYPEKIRFVFGFKTFF